MMMITLLFIVIMIAGIYLYRTKNQAAPVNRYNKKKIEHKVENKIEPLSHQNDVEEREADDALGLTVIEKKPETVSISTPHKPTLSQSDCVVVLYLMAPEGVTFSGYELLQALLSAGLRYGKQRIFNRHEHKDGRGDVLFHCASAMAPGTFDLTQMGSFSCKGLCLFFTASSVADPLATFDCMLEMIDQLVDDIGGRVLDENRMLFSKERMVKYRQQLRMYENGKVTADLFD